MNSKVFSQRFNSEIAQWELPDDTNDKIQAVAKVFGVTRHLARAMMYNNLLPARDQLDRIAKVLEVCPLWLGGETNRKKAYTGNESMESA